MNNVKAIQKINEAELQSGSKKSWHDMYSHSAYVFIGGLDYGLTEGDVLSVFSQYGEIININLVKDKKTGKSKGYCFLCYDDQRSTILAVDNLNGIKLCGRTLRVDHVSQYRRPKDESGNEIIEKGCAPRTPTPSPTPPPSPSPEPVNQKRKKEKKLKKKKKLKTKKRRASGSDSFSSHDAMEGTREKKSSSKRPRIRDVDDLETREHYRTNKRARKGESTRLVEDSEEAVPSRTAMSPGHKRSYGVTGHLRGPSRSRLQHREGGQVHGDDQHWTKTDKTHERSHSRSRSRDRDRTRTYHSGHVHSKHPKRGRSRSVDRERTSKSHNDHDYRSCSREKLEYRTSYSEHSDRSKLSKRYM